MTQVRSGRRLIRQILLARPFFMIDAVLIRLATGERYLWGFEVIVSSMLPCETVTSMVHPITARPPVAIPLISYDLGHSRS